MINMAVLSKPLSWIVNPCTQHYGCAAILTGECIYYDVLWVIIFHPLSFIWEGVKGNSLMIIRPLLHKIWIFFYNYQCVRLMSHSLALHTLNYKSTHQGGPTIIHIPHLPTKSFTSQINTPTPYLIHHSTFIPHTHTPLQKLFHPPSLFYS